jgi:multiple sugar transport system permease protein
MVKRPWFTLQREDMAFGAIMVAPAMIFLSLVLGYPLFYLFQLALSKVTWRPGYITLEWVGLANFGTLLHDNYFWQALQHTGHIVVASVPISFLLALGLALALDRISHGRVALQTILLFPWMVAPALSSSMWRWLYHDQFGIIDYMLKSIGIIKDPILWLADPRIAIYSVIICDVWQYTPFCMVLLFAGLQDIPEYLYEAAKIDGANAWQLLRYITLPHLKPLILFVLLIRTIFTLRIFDFVYTLTGGGPARSTEVLATFLYKNGFQYMKYDYSAAIAVALLCITIIAVVGFLTVFRQNDQP